MIPKAGQIWMTKQSRVFLFIERITDNQFVYARRLGIQEEEEHQFYLEILVKHSELVSG